MNINKGIHANTVNAEVIAVGDRATAIKSIPLQADLKQDVITAIQKLKEEFNIQIEDENANQQLNAETQKLAELLEKGDIQQDEAVGVLTNLSGKLGMIKGFLKDTASIRDNIKTIATLLKIPVSLIGLPF